MNSNTVVNKTTASAMWLIARFGVRQLFNTIAFFIIASLISAEELGLGALAAAVGMTLKALTYRGVRDYVIRVNVLSRTDYANSYWTNAIIGFILFGLILLASLTLNYLNRLDHAYLYIISALIPLFVGVSAVNEGVLERNYRHKKITMVQSVASVSSSVIAIIIAFQYKSAISIVLIPVIESISVSIATLLYSKKIPIYGFNASKSLIILKQSFALMVISLINANYGRLALILIGIFLGYGSAGLFRISLQAFGLLQQAIVMPMSQALTNGFSRERATKSTHYSAAIFLSSALMSPIFLGCALILPIIIPLVLGPSWQAAGSVAAILMFSVAYLVIAVPTEAFLIATKNDGPLIWLSTVGVIAGLSLVMVGSQWGLSISALGFVLRAVFTVPLAHWFGVKASGTKLAKVLLAWAWPLASALLMYGISVLLDFYLLSQMNDLLRLVALVACGVVTYATLMTLVHIVVRPSAMKAGIAFVRRREI